MRMMLRLTRQSRLHRILYIFALFAIVGYIANKVYIRYYEKYLSYDDFVPIAPAYSDYIDQKGNFVPYYTYKIIQFVESTLPAPLTELYTYLNQQDELKQYFQLVPTTTYHVILTDLKPAKAYDEKQLDILKQEQAILDKDDTELTCAGKQLLFIDRSEIRMEVEIKNDRVVEYQKRWTESFPKLITKHHSTFYITLAYQYKNIPDSPVLKRLEDIVKNWQSFPIDIPLDPIEICSYDNIVTPAAVVSGGVAR